MAGITSIPVISLEGLDSEHGQARVAGEMEAAYTAVGFAYLIDHGIPASVIDEAFAASAAFHALPLAEKQRIAVNRYHRGYIACETATDRASSIEEATQPNLSESFIKLTDPPMSAKSGWPIDGPNQWPGLPGFREALTEFEQAAEDLAHRLVGALATGMDVPPHMLLDLFNPPTAWLRLLHYPEQPADGGGPDGGQFGSAPHTDFGCLTLLFQDSAGGLEVQGPDGAWIAAPPRDGAIIVNTGDIVPVWSGGRWRSTPHRVVNPLGRDRYSIAYFFDPSLDARIAPLDGSTAPAPFVFGDHVMSQLDATYDYRRDDA